MGFIGSADEETGDSLEEWSILPHWSAEDKSERIVVTAPYWIQLLRANLPLTLSFSVVLLIILDQDNTIHLQQWTLKIIVTFIVLQTICTTLQAIPDNATDTSSLDARTTAIIFQSMVLYPCLGLWILEHDRARTLPGLSNLWNPHDDQGTFTWGYVFPFLLWGMSALLFSRDAYSAFTYDTNGIVTDPTPKSCSVSTPITQLYRRIPGPVEVFMAKFCRIATSSLWHVLPEDIKPPAKGGRFLFQLLAPTCLTFFYIGYRFCAYSIDEIQQIISIGPAGDFCRSRLEGVSDTVVQARYIVWFSFFLHTIFLRAVIPSQFFLRLCIRDYHSLKHRSIDWQRIVAPSKRSRLLWGFRGWTLAFVPFALRYHAVGDESDGETSPLRKVMYWLYVSQYISYFLEGVLALIWGLNEATRHCNLTLPFAQAVGIFFWAAYNAYLQPLGTVINYFFYIILKEGVRGIHLTEIYGPCINARGVFRECVVQYLFMPCLALARLASRRSGTDDKSSVDQSEIIEERLQEWLQTWRRKRREVGKSAENYTVVPPPSKNKVCNAPVQVFSGTVFPKQEEYLYMRDHPADFISMDPWDKHYPESKFLSHFPAYAEEVQRLLKETYDFDNKREVWMFGYGSLLSPDTPPAGLTDRQRKLLLPYWLKKSAGYKNSWAYRHGSCGINALGLLPVPEAEAKHICGCVYPIDYEVACELFSYREDGYEFTLISVEHFEAMHPSYKLPLGVGYIWICGAPTKTCKLEPDDKNCDDWNCKRHLPTHDSPILQTYIDSIMTGALRYSTSGAGQEDGMKFCAAILSTIQDWDCPWHNDRILPGRPWIWRHEWQLIDGMLNTCPNTGAAFSRRLNANFIVPEEVRLRLIHREQNRFSYWSQKFFSGWIADSPETERCSGGLHATGDIDRVAPLVEVELAGANAMGLHYRRGRMSDTQVEVERAGVNPMGLHSRRGRMSA